MLGDVKMCMMVLTMCSKHKCDWNLCGLWNVYCSVSKVEVISLVYSDGL